MPKHARMRITFILFNKVREITGDGMKAFGRDTGYNTEGRRNHIESYKYTADDGSKRTRVKFNIKGNKGQVHVWVEVRTSQLSL